MIDADGPPVEKLARAVKVEQESAFLMRIELLHGMFMTFHANFCMDRSAIQS